VKGVFLEAREKLNIEKLNQRPFIPRDMVQKFAPLPNILTTTREASETVDLITECCSKSHANIVGPDTFRE
jgi:hypothetical protein